MDTIFALATAPGRAGVAVIRLSGPDSVVAVERLAGPLPNSGRSLRKLRGPDGDLLDEALVLVFAKRASFTGEQVVELQTHGSPAVVQAVMAALAGDDRLRLAQAGEFTRRAFENGRLDLAQVEGLADLIAAETEAQRKLAMRLMSGELGAVAEVWRRDLIRARALIEATIDFADEEVPVDVGPEVGDLVLSTKAGMARIAEASSRAERVRQGFELAIVGPPNAGKSTLLNYLAGREAAITSIHAGTTRDVIEVRMDIGGLPVTLLDTAGIRQSIDPVEKVGIDRALDRAASADLRIHLLEEGVGPVVPVDDDDLLLAARDDDGSQGGVSGKTGAGVERLLERVSTIFSARASDLVVAGHERHRLALRIAIGHLDRVGQLLPDSVVLADEVAEELRLALRAVDSIVGHVDAEQVLDVVFSNFCIGK